MNKVETFKAFEKALCANFDTKGEIDFEVLDLEVTKKFSIKNNMIKSYRHFNFDNRCANISSSFNEYVFDKGTKFTVILNREAKSIVALIRVASSNSNSEYSIVPQSRKEENLVKYFDTVLNNSKVICVNDFTDKIKEIKDLLKAGRDPYQEAKDSAMTEALLNLKRVLENSPLFIEKSEKTIYSFNLDKEVLVVTYTLKSVIKDITLDYVKITFDKETNNPLDCGTYYSFDMGTLTEDKIEFITEYGKDVIELQKAVNEAKKASDL